MAGGTVPQTAEITFTDRFGDERVVRRNGTGYHLKRDRITPVQAISQNISLMIGARIREVREAKGMTLAELCIAAGLSSATPKNRMWEIENSPRREGVTLGTVYAIAIALGVEVAELIPTTSDAKRFVRVQITAGPTLVVAEGR